MPAVVTRALRKQFGKLVAVRDLDLEVPAGSVFGLLGPNGAGKSTLIRMLTTLVAPTSGEAWVEGHEIRSSAAAVRRSIGFLPQSRTSDLDLTAAENLDFYAGLYGFPARERKALIDTLLDSMDLAEQRDRLARTFSGGMRRRLEIARCLVHQPRVLFLDEPTSGLDPVSRAATWDLLKRLQARTGLTLVFTTHIMEEAEQLCGEAAILDRGKLVARGAPKEVIARFWSRA